MAGDAYQELPRAKRRRLIVRAVLRSLLSATVLVVLYYLLPLDRPWGADTAVRLLASLLVFAGVMVWQVRKITRSRYPGVQAVEALGLIVPLFLLLFASTYFVMERASAAAFTQPLTRTDALYFTVTVFSTVGFGDISPKSEAARVVLIVQMLGDLAILGAGIRVLLGPCSAAASKDQTQAAAARPLPDGRPATSTDRGLMRSRHSVVAWTEEADRLAGRNRGSLISPGTGTAAAPPARPTNR